jgi:hypothetical protein
MIHFDSDNFKMMLVTSKYVPDKVNHKVRLDIGDNEVVNGNGYIRGGKDIAVTLLKDGNNDRIEVNLNGATWDFATISAGGAIYYKSRGSASIDDLICYVQFSQDASSVDGNFVVTPSKIRIQN